ncbi:hypothetical protein ACFQ8T_12525 [Isoptericola sp. NPDC056618]|uniref:hypothetical protein n=1 Tax=Isoptericola sp. NPDC056618 TaxID=3345878 RepID=UPI003693759E
MSVQSTATENFTPPAPPAWATKVYDFSSPRERAESKARGWDVPEGRSIEREWNIGLASAVLSARQERDGSVGPLMLELDTEHKVTVEGAEQLIEMLREVVGVMKAAQAAVSAVADVAGVISRNVYRYLDDPIAMGRVLGVAIGLEPDDFFGRLDGPNGWTAEDVALMADVLGIGAGDFFRGEGSDR